MRTIPKDLWANDETWIVQLWLLNNEGAQKIAKKASEEAWAAARDDHLLSRMDNAIVLLAGWLKESIESNNPLNQRERDMYSELVARGLDRVEWREIAKQWLLEIAAGRD